MTKKVYPKGKCLIEMFIETIGSYDGFNVLCQDTICQFIFDGRRYYAYFKCVTPEGKPHPIEHQRAQLPRREEFYEVKNSSDPFLFLGYDVDNDVFVCWEPHKVKPRLNNKSYVSFYSRLSVQQSVRDGEIKEEVLTNGDKFVLFKRGDVIPFLQMIDTHFPELKVDKKPSTCVAEKEHVYEPFQLGEEVKGRIIDVREDDSIRLLIDNYDEDTETLAIVSECMNQFGVHYQKMKFSDWGKLVRNYRASKQS